MTIADHALIGDCHSAALIRSDGTIDWCCLPRFDSPSVFAGLLDETRGGVWSMEVLNAGSRRRRYLEDSLILMTEIETADGALTVTDLFAMRNGGRERPRRMILRLLDGVRGRVDVMTRIAPRFDYGRTSPWVRRHSARMHSFVGSSNGLILWSDVDLHRDGEHQLAAAFTVQAGDRRSFSMRFVPPESVPTEGTRDNLSGDLLERFRTETIGWWGRWSSGGDVHIPHRDAVMRSAITLKSLTHAPTGALIAAPTTSLPEESGGERNWDYRFSWIRDASFSVRALDELGFRREADGFRRFVERSAAGSAQELQVLYGVGGERRVIESEIEGLSGFDGARPVRVGNRAADQFQLDIFGELLEVAWQWHRRGDPPAPDYRLFLASIADRAAEVWRRPDQGIWEIRGRPAHFVYSKAMCWVALDRAIRFGARTTRVSIRNRWTAARAEIRSLIDAEGSDPAEGTFNRELGVGGLDASLLLLPQYGFVPYDDPRMIRTADAIARELGEGGLIRRYRTDDGLKGKEGPFIACTFWLAACYARQGRLDDAEEIFERASATANDLGLFGEGFDPGSGEMLGNFPQGLSHLAHLDAAVAIARGSGEKAS